MKIKPLVNNFLKPEFKTDGSAGMDIYLQQDINLVAGIDNVIHLGFASELPRGFVAVLVPRSSTGIKGIRLRNTVGVIDADYRGEWIAHITIDEQGDNFYGKVFPFKRGDRLLQALILPYFKFNIQITDKLSNTKRGESGFGGTGK